MKTNNLLSAKAALLTMFLLFGINRVAISSSFIATFSGNWSSASTWGGNNPGFITGSGNNIIIPAGVTVILDSDLTVEGTLTLNGGLLNLNGQDLAINGGIITTGPGAVIGNNNSNISFNGYGGAGNLVFAPGSQVINNLTINIGSNSGMFLASALTINGALNLINGSLGINNDNLTLAGKGDIQGGSSSSYVMIAGTGSLIVAVPNSGRPYTFQVGTQNNYAPIAITNNSTTTGTFAVSTYEGVLADGNTGNDICTEQSTVNTSWNVTSSITTGANVDLEMSWNTNMQVNGFTNTQAYLSQYTAKGWNVSEPTTATVNSDGSFSLKLTGVISFSQYAVFGKNSATAINNVTANAGMGLYPNPASGSINISLAQTGNYPLLKIFDAQGKEVIVQQIEDNLTTLNINGLSKGIYFASLDGKAAQKFIKE